MLMIFQDSNGTVKEFVAGPKHSIKPDGPLQKVRISDMFLCIPPIWCFATADGRLGLVHCPLLGPKLVRPRFGHSATVRLQFFSTRSSLVFFLSKA